MCPKGGGLYWSQSEKLYEIKPPLVNSDFVIMYYAEDRKKLKKEQCSFHNFLQDRRFYP